MNFTILKYTLYVKFFLPLSWIYSWYLPIILHTIDVGFPSLVCTNLLAVNLLHYGVYNHWTTFSWSLDHGMLWSRNTHDSYMDSRISHTRERINRYSTEAPGNAERAMKDSNRLNTIKDKPESIKKNNV